jgi:hypothetical protein
MNYHRGFFRIWVALSALWIASMWLISQSSGGLSCMWQAGPWCNYRFVPDLPTGLGLLFAAPALALAGGAVMIWIIAGFRRHVA